MNTHPRPTRALAILTGLTIALAGLHGPAATSLSIPPVDQVGAWFSFTDPATVFMTGLRALAIGLGWYLLALTTAHLVLGLAGRRSTLVDRLTPAAMRPLLGVMLSATALSATTLAPPSGSHLLVVPSAAAESTAPTDATSPPVTMVRIGDAPDPEPPAQPHEVPETPTASSMTMVGLGPTMHSAGDLLAQPPVTASATWTVTEGDHFWSISGEVQRGRLGRYPTPAEHDRYWRTLIDANIDRLADPDNPDLLLVGQVLDLPPTQAAS